MSDVHLVLGDCLEKMRTMPSASVDSIVTDPPYGLGFMGKKWDIGVPAVDVFAECLRVLKPGGTVLDPFMGSGSTGKAAVLEGFDFIGIDADEESVETARRRIDEAAQQ